LLKDQSEVSNSNSCADDESALSRRRFISQVGLCGMIFLFPRSLASAESFDAHDLNTSETEGGLLADGFGTNKQDLEEDPIMPIVKIDALEGRSDAEVKTLLDATHRAIVAAFGVPLRDRYQIYQAHRQAHVVFQDTGLGIPRTDRFVLFTVFSKQRAEALKVKLYAELTRELQGALSIPPSDVMVCIVENSGADWSFGNGIAQFLTGDLK
jgi:phenylpyruvate tautomerase PptA (4-oxalocrotonate tautomerase family)